MSIWITRYSFKRKAWPEQTHPFKNASKNNFDTNYVSYWKYAHNNRNTKTETQCWRTDYNEFIRPALFNYRITSCSL